MIDFKSRKYKIWEDGMYVPLSEFDGNGLGLNIIKDWMIGLDGCLARHSDEDCLGKVAGSFGYWYSFGGGLFADKKLTRKQALYIVTGKVYN